MLNDRASASDGHASGFPLVDQPHTAAIDRDVAQQDARDGAAGGPSDFRESIDEALPVDAAVPADAGVDFGRMKLSLSTVHAMLNSDDHARAARAHPGLPASRSRP